MNGFEAGQTGLIVPVPAAEEVVGEQRAAHDSSARLGVPAHVTVLFPFVPLTDVDEPTVAEVLDSQSTFEVTFDRVGRFPGVLWLDPRPAEPLRGLTMAVASCWPDFQPYGGQFDGVVPHLTVAEGDDDVLAAAERAVLPGLPLTTRVDEVRLIGFDGRQWETVASFALPPG